MRQSKTLRPGGLPRLLEFLTSYSQAEIGLVGSALRLLAAWVAGPRQAWRGDCRRSCDNLGGERF